MHIHFDPSLDQQSQEIICSYSNWVTIVTTWNITKSFERVRFQKFMKDSHIHICRNRFIASKFVIGTKTLSNSCQNNI